MINIQTEVPLAPLTTFKVGGAARFFTRAESEEDVAGAFDYARANSLPLFVLGGGSNILVSDDGFDGLVLQIALKGIDRDNEIVTAQAGEDWDPFVAMCVEQDLAGVECLSGIPGLAGGTPVQNVGAYGQEVSETIVSVRCFDRARGTINDLSAAACEFTYRSSIFNSTERDMHVVLSVSYVLNPGGAPKIAYKDLREHFAGNDPSLRQVRDAVLNIRRSKSMVIGENDPNSRSAGSFFKNPIVSQAKFDEISERSSPPSFPSADGVKIPAAWLIENSGFYKGFKLGNAGISTRHSLAVVNLGGATAAEIVGLKEKIQAGVLREFDILLEPEPVFVGFD
ncbi:MAG TPA: UDP-N-acetylmuramate dehydrogenase [Pyrinomonadaceae bacterium]|nr:UDP-N-acetylmuramate dehydrogenase [Pyrinomonadaceae bacterium]